MGFDEFDIFRDEQPSAPATADEQSPLENREVLSNAVSSANDEVLGLARRVNESLEAIQPRIMIVDDDRTVRESLALVLRQSYDLTECSSGDQAIAEMNTDIYAVILDVKMDGKGRL